MKLISYDAPRLPEFGNGLFHRSTRYWREKIDLLLFQNRRFRKELHDYWVRYIPTRRTRERIWLRKLYLCLRVRNFWPCVARLIRTFGNAPFPWKFYMAPFGFDRPDKIVFYFQGSHEQSRFLRQVRRLLPKGSFHTLRHTASTGEIGIEGPKRRGIHVGLDPIFLRESWRKYRSLCVGWAEVNREYLDHLPGGRERWFHRMNLSIEHEGPASLSPKRKNLAYIRRYWKLIQSVERSPRRAHGNKSKN